MTKQYRSDGTEIRDGESAVPGYVPFHLREAAGEGEALPKAVPHISPDLDDQFWSDMGITPPPAELLDVEDPGEAQPPPDPSLTPSQATDANIDRIYDLITSPLCHDWRYRPLKPKDQLHILSLVMTRILWKDVPDDH